MLATLSFRCQVLFHPLVINGAIVQMLWEQPSTAMSAYGKMAQFKVEDLQDIPGHHMGDHFSSGAGEARAQLFLEMASARDALHKEVEDPQRLVATSWPLCIPTMWCTWISILQSSWARSDVKTVNLAKGQRKFRCRLPGAKNSSEQEDTPDPWTEQYLARSLSFLLLEYPGCQENLLSSQVGSLSGDLLEKHSGFLALRSLLWQPCGAIPR
eukprot:g2397.t1